MQIVKTLCDICYHEDSNTQTESNGSNLIQLNKQNIEIDLCEKHFAALHERLNIYFSLGRRPEAFNLKIPRSSSRSQKPRDPNATFPCEAPDCNRSFDTPQGRAMHTYRAHTNPSPPRPVHPPVHPRRQPPTPEERQRRLERKRANDRERKRQLRIEARLAREARAAKYILENARVGTGEGAARS